MACGGKVLWAALLVGLGWLADPVAACEGAYCNRVDKGSCGNACCKLEWIFNIGPKEVMKALNHSLHSGGGNGQYTANSLYEGGTGFADLTEFKAPAQFIGQGTHTSKVKRFNDTLNFAVYKVSDTKSKVIAFSISNIGGALGDEGQNYSNLKELAVSLGLVFDEKTIMGCAVEGMKDPDDGPKTGFVGKLKGSAPWRFTLQRPSALPRKAHSTQKLRLTKFQTRMHE